jgi:hypothetical protein
VLLISSLKNHRYCIKNLPNFQTPKRSQAPFGPKTPKGAWLLFEEKAKKVPPWF